DIVSCGVDECLKRPEYGVIEGDCDDKAILAGAMLSRISIPWRIVTVSYRPDNVQSHVYLEVCINGQYLPFDATYPANQIFWELPYTKKIVWNNPMMYKRQYNVNTLEGNLGDSTITDVLAALSGISGILGTLANLPLIGGL